ncbi:hypothetical protein HN51_016034, partial [Arachis hypogaea]
CHSSHRRHSSLRHRKQHHFQSGSSPRRGKQCRCCCLQQASTVWFRNLYHFQ